MKWTSVSLILSVSLFPFGAQAAWCGFWGSGSECGQPASVTSVQPTVRNVQPMPQNLRSTQPSVRSWGQNLRSTKPSVRSWGQSGQSTNQSLQSWGKIVNFRAQRTNTNALEKLGEKIFFDKNLSAFRTQSCASCHDPKTGFTDPDVHQPTSLGGDGVSFGTRNSPTLSYVGHIPDFELASLPNPFLSIANTAQNNPGVPLLDLPLADLLALMGQNIVLSPQSFGGFFLDGRAATLEAQAKVPFFAANEMGLESPDELARRLRWSWYSWEFMSQFGYDVFNDSNRTLDGVATALAAFQRTKKFAPFTSKFDRVVKGADKFSESESRGQALFNGKAGCVFCHTSPQDSEQLFSDFAYHNVGTPKNYTLLNNIGNPDFSDRGRGVTSNDPHEEGMFRTPTLRNVAKTAPYMHNGVFNTLHEVVNFYNNRDIAFESELRTPFTTPAPLVGNMRFTNNEVDDIVAFLRTLSDQ